MQDLFISIFRGLYYLFNVASSIVVFKLFYVILLFLFIFSFKFFYNFIKKMNMKKI